MYKPRFDRTLGNLAYLDPIKNMHISYFTFQDKIWHFTWNTLYITLIKQIFP
jgi:hypothetical protein